MRPIEPQRRPLHRNEQRGEAQEADGDADAANDAHDRPVRHFLRFDGSSLPLASSGTRVKLEPVIDELVAELFGDLTLQLFDLVVVELDHLARLHVDQVVVMLVGHFLEARTPVAKIVPLQNAGLFEQAARSDRRSRC